MPFIPIESQADETTTIPADIGQSDDMDAVIPQQQTLARNSGPARGFIPLAATKGDTSRGFVPLDRGNQSSALDPALETVKDIGRVYPVLETAGNLASQAIAMPIAGLAGLGAVVAKAVGLTDAEPADVVNNVAGALTYQPQTESGKHLTQAVMYPFEALHEGATWVGDKTLAATGSPGVATAAHTAIEGVLPMAVMPGVKAARESIGTVARESVTDVSETNTGAQPVPRDDAAEIMHRLGTAGDVDSAVSAALEVSHAPIPAVERPGSNEAGPVNQSDLFNQVKDATAQGLGSTIPAEQPLPAPTASSGSILPRSGQPADHPLASLTTALNPDGTLWVRGDGAKDAINFIAPDARFLQGKNGVLVSTRFAQQIESAINDAKVSTGGDILDTGNFAESISAQPDLTPSIPVTNTPDPFASLETTFKPDGTLIVSGDGAAEAIRTIAPDAKTLKRADGSILVGAKSARQVASAIEDARTSTAQAANSPLLDTTSKHPVGDDAKFAEQPAPPSAAPTGTVANTDIDTGLIVTSAGMPFKTENGARMSLKSRGKAFASSHEIVPHPDGGFALKRIRAMDAAEQHALQASFIIPKADRNSDWIVSGNGAPFRNTSGASLALRNRGDEFASAHRVVQHPDGGFALERIPLGEMKSSVSTDALITTPEVLGRPVTEYTDDALASLKNHAQGEAAEHISNEIQRRTELQAQPVPEEQTESAGLQNMAVQNASWNPGVNYAPFVDQVRPPAINAESVADLPKPIRRESIIKDFANGLGTTVYEGRVKGKNTAGFFRRGVEEVRTKRANDIETAAHELAHLIDSRIPELSRAWRTNKPLREELRSVSYDRQSVPEGFAEAVRLWMTQPETLAAKAPKVNAWLNDFAGRHEYGPAMKQAQERMTAWFGQDALNRARSKIGTDKPLSDYLDRFWDRFRQSTSDDLHGIYNMERDLTGKIAPVGPYESARLSRASASIADGAVRFGYPQKQADGSFKYVGKGLEDILKPVADNLEDALLYFVGRSSTELMMQGREHLFTQGEIQAMLRLKTPERAKAFEEYQAWNKGILDFAEANGIINPEARQMWQRTQYMPFHRVDQPGSLKGKPGDWSGIQALTGGTTNLKDILGNMIGNAAMLIDKSVKNEARLKVASLSQRPGGAKFMVKIDPEARPVRIGGDQVLDAMLKRYGISTNGDAPAFFEFLIHGQPPAGSNVVAALKNGKPVWFEVGDPILLRSLKLIDRPFQSDIVRWLSIPKRIGQLTVTATPDFWMGNIARDTLMGSVMSRTGFRPILDSLQGMRLRMASDPLYRDYIANGGGLSSIYLDERHLRTKLEKFYRDQGIDYRTVLDAPDKMLAFVETLGDAFEMSTRLGEYRRAVQQGENPRHAAYLGREVSTDFAMKGDSAALGFMYDTVMFLRPAVVSMDRLYRGLAHDPNKGAIAIKAGTIALLSVGLYLINRNRPEYQDMEDWKRDAYWHFYVPTPDGQTKHFMYPKIWEIGALASAAERSVEKVTADNPMGLGKDFARIIGTTFGLNLMPQLLAPPYEQATNRNSFTGAPIETTGMENVQPFLRAKPGTSETMKVLGRATGDMPEWAQVNPVRAEALLRGYFNTWALYGLMLTDQAFFSKYLPEKRADELPVVRRFYQEEPAQHTKYETEFYDMLEEARRLRGTLKELDDMGRSDWADRKEQSPLAGEAEPLGRAQKNLRGLNQDMEDVRRDDTLTPKQKREKFDKLTVERNALLKGAVTESVAAQQGFKAIK